jgi:hypothetical protein
VIIYVGSFSPVVWLYQTFQILVVVCFPLGVIRVRSLNLTSYCVGYYTITNGLPLKNIRHHTTRISNVPYNRCIM